MSANSQPHQPHQSRLPNQPQPTPPNPTQPQPHPTPNPTQPPPINQPLPASNINGISFKLGSALLVGHQAMRKFQGFSGRPGVPEAIAGQNDETVLQGGCDRCFVRGKLGC